MGTRLGFFEKRRLGKKINSIVINLPRDHGYTHFARDASDPRYKESFHEYLAAAEKCGIDVLLRVAETLDELPKAMPWKEGDHNKRFRLYAFCFIGLSELLNQNNIHKFTKLQPNRL